MATPSIAPSRDAAGLLPVCRVKHVSHCIGLALLALGSPAFAQFTCINSSSTSQGATATYSTDVACGPNAVSNGFSATSTGAEIGRAHV